MISYDFGMHRAGVFLLLPPARLLALVGRRGAEGGCSSMGVLCDHRVGHRQRNVRSRLWLKFVFACIPSVSVGQPCRLRWCARIAAGTVAATVRSATRIATGLGENRRSVSEKALLQDQFSERKCAGWSGVE